MNVQIDLPDVSGFEYTGEYRVPKKGEWFLCCENLSALEAQGGWTSFRPILKKKAPVYKVTMVDTGRELFKYVEMKALEHAMRIINSMNANPDREAVDYDSYSPLMDLIK